jgi:hypothetical protein
MVTSSTCSADAPAGTCRQDRTDSLDLDLVAADRQINQHLG